MHIYSGETLLRYPFGIGIVDATGAVFAHSVAHSAAVAVLAHAVAAPGLSAHTEALASV